MPISQRDRDFLISKGIDPDTASYADESDDSNMSGLHAATSTLKAHAGGILGGGGGTLLGTAAGVALAPETGGLSLAIPLVMGVGGGLGGSYAGEKAQEAVLPSDIEARLQDEAAQAQTQHPWISRGTDIAASALASGGSLSPSSLLKGGRAALAGDFANPVLRNIATQAAINPAIDVGTSLAQGQGLPSGKDLLGDVVGGALFSEPSTLGRLGHRSSGEPSPEPTADLSLTPPVGTGDIGPLRMAPQTELPTDQSTGNAAKNTDLVTQNTMDRTSVSENPIDKKAVTEVPTVQTPQQIPEDATGKSGLTKAEEDNLRTTTINSAPEPSSYKVTVQHDNEVPGSGYVQVDEYKNGENIRSTNPETLQKEGVDIPSREELMKLPQGQHYLDNIVNKVNSPLIETTIRNPISLAQHIQSGKATTGSVLQHYVNSPDHPFNLLAQHFLKIADVKSLNTPWLMDRSPQGRSQYEFGPNHDQVVMNPKGAGDARVTMEEAAHSLTSQKLNMFHGYEGAELKNRMDRYLTEGNNDAIKEIIRSYYKTAEHFGYSDLLFKDTYNEADRPNKGAAGNPDVAMELGEQKQKGSGGVLYGMGSLDEFVAHAFKNEQFQHLLNEIPSGVEGKSIWRCVVDSVKKLLGVDVKQGSMLEHILSKSSDLIAQERPSNLKVNEGVSHAPKNPDEEHYMGPIGRFTRDVISRVKDIGRPDARELADATKLSLNEQDRLEGRYRNSTIEAGQKMNKHDLDMINRVIDKENTTGTLHKNLLDSDAQRNFYDVVKKNMSETGDYAIKVNMPVASDNGPRPLKKDPSHWPSMINDEKRQVYQSGDLAKIAAQDKEFDEWNQTKVGLTPAGSAKVIKDYKEAIQGSIRSSDVSHQDQFKAFRRAMGTPIPPSFREPNPVKNMARYFDRASIALSHYKYIESNPQVMATLGATHDAWGKPITPNPNGSLANNPQVKDLLSQFKGSPRGLGDAAEQSASSLMSNLLISGPTLESHKLISNAVGAVNLSDNPYQLSRALAYGLTGIKEGYRHAVENGLAKLSASSTLDMFNGSLSASQRMNSVGKLIRDVSTLGGLTTKANLGFLQSYFEYLVPSKIQRANAGDINSQRFIKRLDPTYAVGKTYAVPETQQLASVASSYIHGTGDIRSLPAWMMNDSELSGFFKLAHWSVAQTNNFMHNVWTPAAQGNIKPLLTSVFGSVVGGYVIKELREQMQGKKSGIPSLTEIVNSDRGIEGNAGPLAYNAIAAMQYSGFGGLLSQVAKYPFDFVYKNIPQGATFPLDQIATDMAKTVGQVTSAIANDPSLNWVDLAKAVTGHILQNDMQLSRIAINQGINSGLITGLPAEKKAFGDKMGQLRRFDMVEGLPYNDIEQTSNPYMNLEQQKFKHEPDVQTAVKMIPELVTNIMDRYRSQPDVMMSKLKALKENQYDTMPSLETMPMQFFKYMSYVQRTKGEDAAQDMMRDYLTHKITNQVKSSVAP